MAGMECDCLCGVDHDNYPECYMEEIRRARKAHRCCECRETIAPGEQYEYFSGKWEGEFQTFRTCLTCRRMRHDLCGCGWEYGGLAEAIWEALGVNPFTGQVQNDRE